MSPRSKKAAKLPLAALPQFFLRDQTRPNLGAAPRRSVHYSRGGLPDATRAFPFRCAEREFRFSPSSRPAHRWARNRDRRRVQNPRRGRTSKWFRTHCALDAFHESPDPTKTQRPAWQIMFHRPPLMDRQQRLTVNLHVRPEKEETPNQWLDQRNLGIAPSPPRWARGTNRQEDASAQVLSSRVSTSLLPRHCESQRSAASF